MITSPVQILISPVKASANYDISLFPSLQAATLVYFMSLDVHTNFKDILCMHVFLICINGFVLLVSFLNLLLKFILRFLYMFV